MSSDPLDTRQSSVDSRVFGAAEQTVPVLLAAWAPDGALESDAVVITAPCVVGRGEDVDLTLQDDKVSKQHFKITRTGDGFGLHDLQSTNGLFLDGRRVSRREPLTSGMLIRAGRTLLVFQEDGARLLEPPDATRQALAGRFHSGALLRDLHETAVSRRHVLLTGPSGTGKELAARALADLLGPAGTPLVTHNAARFSSEGEATSTLFGVAARTFSEVDPRPGLLEQAAGGVLFLDEVHNLPHRVQRSLLRVLEDGQLARIGETRPRSVDLLLVLTSNAPGPDHGLAHDLLARLRVVRIPPLAQRTADVPTIFLAVLARALSHHRIPVSVVVPLLGGDHFEALCLDGFSADNVRGLRDLADRLASRIATGTDPERAVSTVFQERFGDGPVAQRSSDSAPDGNRSHYERHKAAIVAAFKECDGNLSATERLLRSRGIRCSRKWIGTFADRWGLR